MIGWMDGPAGSYGRMDIASDATISSPRCIWTKSECIQDEAREVLLSLSLSPSLLVSFPFDELILPPVRFCNRAPIFSRASSLCIVCTASSPFDTFPSQGIRLLYLSIHRLRGFFQTTIGKLADLRDDDYAIMLFIATMDMYNRLLNTVDVSEKRGKIIGEVSFLVCMGIKKDRRSRMFCLSLSLSFSYAQFIMYVYDFDSDVNNTLRDAEFQRDVNQFLYIYLP